MKTLREIAGQIGMPESTLRLCRDEFEDFLPTVGEGRRRRYGDAAAKTLAQIAGWKRSGWASTQIRDALARQARPEERVRRRNTDDRLDELAALLRAQAGEIAMLRVEVGALRAELKQRAAESRRDAPPTFEEALAAAASA